MSDMYPDSENPPINMEALLEDSVAHILSHEDPQLFVGWLQSNIDNYYSGQDARQESLFENVQQIHASEEVIDPDMLKTLASNIAIMIWNSMPLPSNHFRPKQIPLPGRNAPCYCGSGKKYKQCCAKIPSMPALPASEIWPLVFTRLDDETAARAIRENQIPTSALGMIASEYIESNQPEKVVPILAPLFEGEIRKTYDDEEIALSILCNAYDDLGYKTRKMTLLQTILDTVPKSPLRSGAWQRLATIRMDDGDVNGAWQAFQHAQRDDPYSLNLGILEVQILHAQGHIEQAMQRADFWVRQMRSAGVTEEEPQLTFMTEVARDPVEAFADIGLDMADNAGRLLMQWLEMVQQRTLPEYTLSNEQKVVEPGEEINVMRDRLLSHGVDEDQVEQAIESMQRQIDESTDIDAEGFPFDDDLTADLDWFHLQTPVKIQNLEQEWQRIVPFPKPFSTHDVPFGEEDPWDVDAELDWSNWLMEHPDAFDSVDILDDLATALVLHPQFGSSWIYDLLLTPVLQRSEDILDKTMVSEGVAELPWIMDANRPALRSLSRQVNIASMKGDSDEIFQRALKLMTLNPRDNHGFRTLIMNQLIYEHRDEEAVELADGFQDDLNPEVSFGKILALYRLNRKKEAVQELGDALEYLDKIPKYLIAKRIKKPPLDTEGVIVGGDDQAWFYREYMRDEWLNTPGALGWLKNTEKVFS